MTNAFLFVTLMVAGAASLDLMPAENQWAVVGKETHLVCHSSEPIQSCTWVTPSGESHTLNEGQQAESGRLRHYAGEDEERDCGIAIAAVEEKDAGQWTCNVGVSVDGSEVVSQSGKASLSLASKPGEIRLSAHFNLSQEDDGQKEAVQCIVANANPKPVFSWYVGEEELVGLEVADVEEIKEDEAPTWTQTLMYAPRTAHANRTLRCVIEHVGLDEADRKEAGVVLRFTQEVVKAAEVVEAAEAENQAEIDAVPYAVAGVVLVLTIAVVAILFAAYKRRKMSAPAKTSEDVEAPVIEGEEGVAKNDDEEKGNADAEEKEVKEESKAPKFTQRIASYLRFKVAKVEEEKKDEEEEGKEMVEINLKDEDKKEEEETDAVTEEVKTDDEEAEKKEEVKESKPWTAARIFNFLKPRRAEKAKEEEEHKAEEGEAEKLKAEDEKPVEYEPEEKEEMNKKEDEKEVSEEKETKTE